MKHPNAHPNQGTYSNSNLETLRMFRNNPKLFWSVEMLVWNIFSDAVFDKLAFWLNIAVVMHPNSPKCLRSSRLLSGWGFGPVLQSFHAYIHECLMWKVLICGIWFYLTISESWLLGLSSTAMVAKVQMDSIVNQVWKQKKVEGGKGVYFRLFISS